MPRRKSARAKAEAAKKVAPLAPPPQKASTSTRGNVVAPPPPPPGRKSARTKTAVASATFFDLPPPPTPRIRYDEEDDEGATAHLPPPVEPLPEVSGSSDGGSEKNTSTSSEGKSGDDDVEEEESEEVGAGPAQLVDLEAGDDDDDDDDVEEEGGTAPVTPKPRKTAAQEAELIKQQAIPRPVMISHSGAKSKINILSGVTMTIDEMVHNCVYYFIMSQHKKHPVKRSDLLKNCMNGQKKDYNAVMAKFETVLADNFGMKIIGLDKGKSGFATYMIVSNYVNDVAETVTVRTPEQYAKRAALFLTLTIMFMLNKPMDEESIWNLIEEFELQKMLCNKKEDFAKFLKSEYVLPMYFSAEEVHDADNVGYKYFWGQRAEHEISKWAILKFVAKQFPDMRPEDFEFQLQLAKEKEKDLIEAEIAARDAAVVDPASGKNGSALKIGEGPDAQLAIEGIQDAGAMSQAEEIEDDDDNEAEADSDEGGEEGKKQKQGKKKGKGGDENEEESGSGSGEAEGSGSDESSGEGSGGKGAEEEDAGSGSGEQEEGTDSNQETGEDSSGEEVP
ncbi:melanoma-associated antigen 10 [Folsomia candida]|nr:melanoma-associated antigen 10 [Folsomia candida]XP_021956673.1 melanoma-associated antigen 10 [Folsomia candida]